MEDFKFSELTPEQILDFGKPCADYEEALKTRKPPSLDWSDPAKALAALRYYVSLQEAADTQDPQVKEKTVFATARDGFQLPVKIFRAGGDSDIKPALVVLYYGGGFVTGSPTLTGPLARSLVKRLGVVVAAPSYRLAPEQPFPTGINDGWDAFAWLHENAGYTFGADLTKGLIVGGVSSGGNISNVVAHLANDTGLQPPITGVWLSCSGVRITPSNAHLLLEKYNIRNLSRRQKECIEHSSSEMAKLIRDSLKPDLDSKLFAPIIWAPDEKNLGHAGFSKTAFQVCGLEPSRDEALIFHDILKEQGTPTRLKMYAGLPHAFFIAFPGLPQSKKWEEDSVEDFAWLLNDKNE